MQKLMWVYYKIDLTQVLKVYVEAVLGRDLYSKLK